MEMLSEIDAHLSVNVELAARERDPARPYEVPIGRSLTVYAKALDAGATVEMEMMDMAHAGERYGGVRDAHGNVWWIATAVATA